MRKHRIVRIEKRAVFKRHIVRLGLLDERDVYYFKDIQKYWVAPHRYRLQAMSARGYTYLTIRYFNNDTGKYITKSCGNVDKIDYSRIMEYLAPNLRKLSREFGCKRFTTRLLESKPYVIYRHDNGDSLLCRLFAPSDTHAKGSQFVGACTLDDKSKLRKLIRKTCAIGKQVVEERKANIDMSIDEALQLLDSDPLDVALVNRPEQTRVGGRSIIDGHIDKAGAWCTRQVYYFKDIQKYWVAPYGVVLTAWHQNEPGCSRYYLSVRYRPKANKYHIQRNVGIVRDIDYSGVFDTIKRKLKPLLVEHGSRRFATVLLESKLYHIAKDVYEDKYRVTALKPLSDAKQANTRRAFIGVCDVDDWSMLRQLIREAKRVSKVVLADRKAAINLPLNEAFQLLDTNPLED